MTTSDTSQVAKFFDAMAELTKALGGNIHVGYWHGDDDPTPLLEAVNRCTDIVGAKLELRPEQRLLDVGCGAGETAIRLARQYGATVTGVTNSGWQVGEATERVAAAGLRDRIRIDLGDAAALSYPEGSFDAVLALESLAHAPSRQEWIRGMVRAVRPGGRVVLTDFTEEVPLTGAEIAILRRDALQPPLPAEELVAVVRDSGLAVDDVDDCGDRIRPSYDAFLDMLTRVRPAMVAKVGEEVFGMQERSIREHMPIYRAKTGYLIITGHKQC
jgi:cyclopropane fatty-acyl-phospholipid synthase-like methyltransferase